MTSSFDLRLEAIAPSVAITLADAHAGLPAPEYIFCLDPPYRVAAPPWLHHVAVHQDVTGKCGYPFCEEELTVIDSRNASDLRNFDPKRRLREPRATAWPPNSCTRADGQS